MCSIANCDCPPIHIRLRAARATMRVHKYRNRVLTRQSRESKGLIL